MGQPPTGVTESKPSRRRFWVNRLDEFKPMACLQLAARLPAVGEDMLFLRSMPEFIKSPAYTAYRIDEVHPEGTHTLHGVGLLAVYYLPFSNELAMAIESAWFADEDVAAHNFVWQYLINEALDAGYSGVCVNPNTVSHIPRMPAADTVHSNFGVFRNKHLLMAGPEGGVWSAFVKEKNRRPQFVDCLRIVEKREIQLTGEVYLDDEPLFRGEGRVDEGPYVGCRSLEDVARKVFKDGFFARSEGTFGGTLQEQILHQGYVSSPTVSLTASSDVAVTYGTANRRRERALVFVVDAKEIRRTGSIWDTFSSMTRHGRAWLQSDFDVIVKLVNGLDDLKVSGSVLAAIDSGIRKLHEDYTETLRCGENDYPTYVGTKAWNKALSVIAEHELSQLCSVFELYFAWQKTPEGFVTANAYVTAFLLMEDELKRALVTSAGKWQDPGWDTTVFGYFAKTCRDKEYLSTGPISGACVREAWLVNQRGDILERFHPD